MQKSTDYGTKWYPVGLPLLLTLGLAFLLVSSTVFVTVYFDEEEPPNRDYDLNEPPALEVGQYFVYLAQGENPYGNYPDPEYPSYITETVLESDDDGYLIDEISEIRRSLLPELSVEDADVVAVLRRVQRLEPVGVASRDTGECILIQLRAQPAGTNGVDLALRLARDYLQLVADNAYEDIIRETGASSENLKQALELIRGLEPRPGARFDNRHDEYLVPDVYVRRDGDEWVTTLSPESNPSLQLNKYYITLLRKSGGKDKDYLNGRLQEARWLLSSLELRNRTLLKVSQYIVTTQQGFLQDGEIGMKPLILKEVAEKVGVHESTVSRATTRKYMLTPRGVFELKYFFSSHVKTIDGGIISATATKARIQIMIDNEPTKKPLSDQEISSLFK